MSSQKGSSAATPEDHKAQVVRYYDDSQFMYDHLWGNSRNLAMHYGFWDEETKSLHEALVNHNKFVADLLQVERGDDLLDAGCGVGGTAIQFAETYSAKVTGVTISEKQVGLARRHALRRGVDGLTSFEERDYCNTDFPDGSFDKAYAIESACYAEPIALLTEMFRVLRAGGKLVVCDGFVMNSEMTVDQQRLYQDLCDGWVVSRFPTPDVFRSALEAAGFENIRMMDVSDKIVKSSREMYVSAKFIYPLVRFLSKMRLVSDAVVLAEKTCMVQAPLLQQGVVGYGVFYAEKPK